MKLFLFLGLILSSEVRADAPSLVDRALPYIQYFSKIRLSNILSHCGPALLDKVKKGDLTNLKQREISPFCASELNWLETQDLHSDSQYIRYTAAQIVESSHSQLEKIQAIHDWVATHITYDVRRFENIQKGIFEIRSPFVSSAKKTLESKTGICIDYSFLTAALLRAVNIPALVVYGKAVVRGGTYDHAWNKAYLQGENRWITMDTTFDSGGLDVTPEGKTIFIKNAKREYFDMNPAEFEKNHIEL